VFWIAQMFMNLLVVVFINCTWQL